MCESHVRNPQTVGKCCSLLNSLLPHSLFPPCLLPSLSYFVGPLSKRASCPAATLCECVCMHASQHTGSARRASARQARTGIAASCRQFLCQYQALHSTHAEKPSKLLVTSSQDASRRREAALFPFYFVCLSLYSISLSLPVPPKRKHGHLSLCVYTTFISLKIQSCGCRLSFSSPSQQPRYFLQITNGSVYYYKSPE